MQHPSSVVMLILWPDVIICQIMQSQSWMLTNGVAVACVEFWHLCDGHAIAGFLLPKPVKLKDKVHSIITL